MSAAHHALLCWMFIRLLGHVEGQAGLVLVGPRTRVVLTGHDLHLNFTATVPRNTSIGFLKCHHRNALVTPAYILVSDLHADQKQDVQVTIHFNDSSQSGRYHCSYNHAKVDLAILVHDGFNGTYTKDEMIAPVATITVLLLIFSTLGSAYIYKRQSVREGHGDNGRVATQSRSSQKGDDEGQEGTSEEAAAAASADNSVYTPLESRPTSIYEVLDRSTSSSRTQSKKKTSKRSKKKDEVASAEDGVFESVYENV